MALVGLNPSAPVYPMNADQVRQNIRDAILLIAAVELHEAPTVFGPGNMPSTNAHASFSVLMQSEDNQGLFRDRKGKYMRIQQSVTVRYAWQLRPNAKGDQMDDMDTARGTVQSAIMRQLMGFDSAHMPGLDFQYVGTDTAVVESGKYALIDVQFAVEHNFDLGPVT